MLDPAGCCIIRSCHYNRRRHRRREPSKSLPSLLKVELQPYRYILGDFILRQLQLFHGLRSSPGLCAVRMLLQCYSSYTDKVHSATLTAQAPWLLTSPTPQLPQQSCALIFRTQTQRRAASRSGSSRRTRTTPACSSSTSSTRHTAVRPGRRCGCPTSPTGRPTARSTSSSRPIRPRRGTR